MKPDVSLRTIFNGALEREDPAGRDHYLEAACGGDRALRKRLESLLAAHHGAGGFLPESSDSPSAAPTTVLPAGEKPGERIGRYKLLEQIGEGGCGVVYMAEQEEPVRRRVALKVIKLGMDTRQVMARFEAERQALAMMDHPNIARVLDAGATDSGRPFFVMELVRGVRITEFCDARKLSARERLALFLPVCQAVQHAHQKGIIHRDLKPSNILVTMIDGTPVPKVIDFGIAKATNNQRLTDLTLFTAFEQFIGTPAYMSPEQAEMSGVDIDTRTDIYSLGVVLYELLTGKTPFDAQAMLRSGIDAIRRTIRETEPPKPSTRLHSMANADLTATAAARHTEAPQLIHQVRGDLDWIAMKCLEKDRNRRYETATGLALDLQRHLNDETVSARPPSLPYQFRKFLRRRRGAALGAAAVLAAMLAGTVVSTRQAVRATRAEAATEAELEAKRSALGEAVDARAEAVAQREQARQAVDEMYTEFSEKLLARTPRMEPVQQAFLEKALAYYERFAAEGSTDPETLRDTAVAARRVGEIREKLGNISMAENAYRRSVALLEAAGSSAEPAAEADRVALAESLHRLGGVLHTAGKTEEAESLVRRAVVLREILATGPSTGQRTGREGLARSLNLLTILLTGRRALPEALETCRRSMAELELALPADSPETSQRLELTRAAILTNLADLLQDSGQIEEAEQHLREARELADRLVAEAPGDPRFPPAQRGGYNNLAVYYLESGNLREAENHFRKAEAISRRLSDEYPLVPDHRLGEMLARANVAVTLRLQDRDAEAETLLREVFTGLESLTREFGENLEYAEILADGYHNLGTVLKERDRLPEAMRFYEQARKISESILARFPLRASVREGLSNTWFNVGLLYLAMEEPDKAFDAFESVIRTAEAMPEGASSLESAHSVGGALTQQARIVRVSRRHPELAMPLLDRADGLIDRCLTANPRRETFRTEHARVRRERADTLLALGRREEAESAFREAIAASRALAGDFPRNARYRNQLGDDLGGLIQVWEEDRSRDKEAIALVREALALQEDILANEPAGSATAQARRSLAQHCETLAILLLESGERSPALEMHRQAQDLRRQLIAENPARKESWCALGGGLNNFAIRLRDTGEPGEALVLLGQAVEAQREALKIDPACERARWFLRNHLMNAAVARRMTGGHPAAMEAYREAIVVGEGLARDTAESPLHRNNLALDLNALAILELEAGQIANALRSKERMIALVETMVDEVGEGLPTRGALADLQQTLARLYALGPDPAQWNAARAVELAKASVINDPAHPAAWHALGLAHCMAGTPAEAIAAVEESIKLTGVGDALNWFVRAMARWELGDKEGARRDQALAVDWLRSDVSKPYRDIAAPYEVEATKRLGS